jgi:hypothetical protein
MTIARVIVQIELSKREPMVSGCVPEQRDVELVEKTPVELILLLH